MHHRVVDVRNPIYCLCFENHIAKRTKDSDNKRWVSFCILSVLSSHTLMLNRSAERDTPKRDDEQLGFG